MAERAHAQRVRIIGGRWRRRLLAFPPLADLRPTPDRVRETLFNWLGQDLDGLSCLDLFAGSGALGFEAASRGAREVVMVEQDPRAVRALEANLAALGLPPHGGTVQIVRADAFDWLQREARRAPGHWDVVFLDPPFRLDLLPRLLPAVEACLSGGGWVYVESPVAAPVAAVEGWATLREARAGGVDYRLLGRGSDRLR